MAIVLYNTFCSVKNRTDRKLPKYIGTSAMKRRLEYATNIPSAVAGIFSVALTFDESPPITLSMVSFKTSAIAKPEVNVYIW